MKKSTFGRKLAFGLFGTLLAVSPMAPAYAQRGGFHGGSGGFRGGFAGRGFADRGFAGRGFVGRDRFDRRFAFGGRVFFPGFAFGYPAYPYSWPYPYPYPYPYAYPPPPY